MPRAEQIGKYSITGQLGAGGMGEVFRAHDMRLNPNVAVKVLPKDYAGDGDRLWEDLRPHPRAQAILRRMNLVK